MRGGPGEQLLYRELPGIVTAPGGGRSLQQGIRRAQLLLMRMTVGLMRNPAVRMVVASAFRVPMVFVYPLTSLELV